MYPCPKDPKGPYNLWELVDKLKENKDGFAQFFVDQVKNALDNQKGAIDCVNSYLTPETQELLNLGIPDSRADNMKRCTESGVLVLVMAKDNV